MLLRVGKFRLKKLKILPIHVIMAVVVCVNLFFLFFYPADGRVEIGDQMAYHTLASNIVKYGTFGERFHVDTPGLHLFHTMPSGEEVSTTFRPPGYPAFLAMLYTVSQNFYFVAIVQSILAIFSLILLFRVAKKYLGEKVTMVALFLYLLLPAFYQLNVSFWSESFTQSILVISICLFLDGKKTFTNLILPGLLLSWSILARPTYAAYLPVLLLLLVVSSIKNKRLDRRLLAIFVVVMLPIIVWSVRCSYVTKKPVFISSTTGINFFLSNNPYVINGRASTWPPLDYLNRNGINVFRNDYNDAVLNQQTTKLGLKWIKDNPWLFLKLVPNRMVYFFAPITNNFLPRNVSGDLPKFVLGLVTIWSSLLGYVLIFFAIIGIWFLPHKKLLLWLLPYLAVIAVTYPENRYFFPLVLPMAFLASYAVINFKKVKTKQTAVAVAVILTYCQISYFGPDLSHQLALTLKSFSNYVDLIRFNQNNPDKYFITDAISSSNNPRVIIKKAPVDNNISHTLVLRGQTVTQDQLNGLIKDGLVYSDLLNPLSTLDKTIYPDNVDQNNLKYDSRIMNSIFQLSGRVNSGASGTLLFLNSDHPNQAEFIDNLIIKRGQLLMIDAKFSSRGKVIICNEDGGHCLDLLALGDLDNFSSMILVDTKRLPGHGTSYKIGLINFVNFPRPNDYNLFTGNRAYFTSDGVQIKVSLQN